MPEITQPAPETDEKKSRGLGSYVLWAFVAVMVYVLSSGPAIVLWQKGAISDGTVRAAYFPVRCVYSRTVLHKPIGMYWH
jgi:hypothetical protein